MLQQRILAFARETGTLRRGDTYVVGVSGGVDSVALLHALRAASSELGIALHVAHLNHGLRGEAAEQDADFVAGLACEWGLSATVQRADVSAYAAEHGLSLEAASRQARYGFFAEVVDVLRAHAVVAGHTADDQAETVLLHLLRGTGLAGLRGMRPTQHLRVGANGAGRPLNVCRPLLGTSRAEVEAYAAQHSLAHREDSSNGDVTFTRNRIRHELLPLLETYNPGARQGIMRMAQLLDDDYQCLTQLAEMAWSDVARLQHGGVSLSLEGLRSVPVAVARLVVREAYAVVAGGLADLTAEHVEQSLSLALRGRTGALLDLPGGVVALRGYGEVLIARGLPAAESLPREGVPLRVPGATVVGTWEVRAELRETPCGRQPADPPHVDLDFDRVGARLLLRRRARGDKMRPVGLKGSKKLQDIMVDAKVPRWERDAVPVLASPAQ
ncbi:MAG: tRNA lysidine(34) synthetase TilS, partial [Chloroflexota bacterium]